MLELKVLSKRIGPVRGRHPWVFSGALQRIPDGIESGAPIQLVDETGRFLASGYFNSYSQIAVRVWGWQEGEEVDEGFFIKRIKAAFELRRDFILDKKTNACRIINSESDLLPGLIVDKYGDYLVAQFHNRGIDKWKKEIVGALVKVLKPKGIYERSDVGNRAKEPYLAIPTMPTGRQAQAGAQPFVILSEAKDPSRSLRDSSVTPQNDNTTGILFGKIPERVTITENGYKFSVDIIGGQKTGFFLDQRDKRLALQKYCVGKNVLNCFSYTGGFSVYALGAGAKKVVSVDTSQPALDLAQENFKLNKLDLKKCDFINEDVKSYLNNLTIQQFNNFQVIILDPPAFIKDRHKIYEGVQGYKKINEAAMRLLPSGGILVSCSCSQHLPLTDFRHIISESAGRAGRTVQILETLTHGIDHPQLAAFTEGEYLKCLIAKVM
ncbi:MAG: class I SAM-dependent rRNA methyltransferase [Candidatus Magasanikbacteria bacterium]